MAIEIEGGRADDFQGRIFTAWPDIHRQGRIDRYGFATAHPARLTGGVRASVRTRLRVDRDSTERKYMRKLLQGWVRGE